MPQVPRYDQPKVQAQGLPNVRMQDVSTPEAFGIGSSQNRLNQAQDRFVGKLASTVDNYLTEEKKKADDVNKLEFDKALSEYQIQVEYGPQGIYSKKGKDVLGSHEEIETNWTKTTQSMIDKLASEDVKTWAKERANQRWASVNESSQRHANAEISKYDQVLTKSYIENAQNEAMHNFANPDRVKQSINEQIIAINSSMDRNGIKDEAVRKNILDENISKTHALVVSQFVESNNDLKAQEYYEANKDQISGQSEIQIKKMIEEGSVKGASQRASDEIVKTSKTMIEALDKARKIEEPKIRDATVSRVKEFYSEQKAAERLQTEDLHKYAANIIEKSATVDAIPRVIWSQFSLSERSALESYAKTMKKGSEPETDYQTLTDLYELSSNPRSKNKFADINLWTYRSKLSNSDYEQMLKLQAGIRKGDSSTLEYLDGVRSKSQIVNDALAGLDVNKKADAEKYESFNRQVDSRVQELQLKEKRKASTADVQKIVDELKVEGVISKGWFFDTKKKQYELEPGEKFIQEDQPKELKRLDKRTGKTAIYDSETKQFLRWETK